MSVFLSLLLQSGPGILTTSQSFISPGNYSKALLRKIPTKKLLIPISSWNFYCHSKFLSSTLRLLPFFTQCLKTASICPIFLLAKFLQVAIHVYHFLACFTPSFDDFQCLHYQFDFWLVCTCLFQITILPPMFWAPYRVDISSRNGHFFKERTLSSIYFVRIADLNRICWFKATL